MPIQTGQCVNCHAVNSYSAVSCLDCKGRLPWADAVEELQKKVQQPTQPAQSASNSAALATQPTAAAAISTTSRAPSYATPASTSLTSSTSVAPQSPSQLPGTQTPVNVYETYFGSIFGKFSRCFADLDGQSAIFVGAFCGVLYSACVIIGAYMIQQQVADMVTGFFGGFGALLAPNGNGVIAPEKGSAMDAVTMKGVTKLFLITCAPFVSIVLSSVLIRKLFSDEEGEFGGDVFLAGMVLLPVGLLVLITGLVGIANWEVTIVLSVAAFSYTIIMLYNGCTIIGRIRDTAAAIAVPVMLLLSGWLTKVILTKLFTSGPF